MRFWRRLAAQFTAPTESKLPQRGGDTMTALGRMRRTLFGIPSEKSVFSRPGFSLRRRGNGFNQWPIRWWRDTMPLWKIAGLRPSSRLDAVEPELRGFAYEGAGMGLAVWIVLLPGRIVFRLSWLGQAHLTSIPSTSASAWPWRGLAGNQSVISNS